MNIINKYFSNLSPHQLEQFIALKNLYADWNEKINVISRKDINNFYEHHVLHSLSIAKQFSFPDGYNIIDIGTGGGFPGIPLAIFFPEVKFHLTDSINKKLKVVNEVANAIELTNVTTQHTRAEDIKDKKFDVAISRAVAPLKDLWQWSKPLLKETVNGQCLPAGQAGSMPACRTGRVNGLICLKGGDLSKEISESGVRPQVWEIEKIFEEEFFEEKYILYVAP